MKRFYSTHIAGDAILLEQEEAQHCIKVLRGRIGDIVEVLDGNGRLYETIITSIEKHEVQVSIQKIKKEITENPNKLSIGICPTKNPARLDWFIEKATEIGVDHIYPILSERTEKATIKQERLQQLIISAAKQSGQLFFPTLHPIQSLKDFWKKETIHFTQKFIAHCENEQQAALKNSYQKNERALLLIGPEGDFSKAEIQLALNNNYIPVTLGNAILRVETAGMVACTIVNNINS